MTAGGVLGATRRLAYALATQPGTAPLVWVGNSGDHLNLLAQLGHQAPGFLERLFVTWDVASYDAVVTTGVAPIDVTAAAPIVIVETLPGGGDAAGWSGLGKWVKQAKTVICLGTEASFGGTLVAPEQARRLTQVCALERTPLIKLPGVPVPPHHLIGTLSHLQFVGFPRLDADHRPELYYSDTVCSTCERRGDLESGRFAARMGESGCFLRIGCRGPVTRNTCSSVRWNGGVNWCVGAGAPCTGCAERGFPDHGGLGLYGRVPGDALSARSFVLENLDQAGKALVGLTALGIGLHLVRRRLERRSTRGNPRPPARQAPKAEAGTKS